MIHRIPNQKLFAIACIEGERERENYLGNTHTKAITYTAPFHSQTLFTNTPHLQLSVQNFGFSRSTFNVASEFPMFPWLSINISNQLNSFGINIVSIACVIQILHIDNNLQCIVCWMAEPERRIRGTSLFEKGRNRISYHGTAGGFAWMGVQHIIQCAITHIPVIRCRLIDFLVLLIYIRTHCIYHTSIRYSS